MAVEREVRPQEPIASCPVRLPLRPEMTLLFPAMLVEPFSSVEQEGFGAALLAQNLFGSSVP